MLGASRFSRRSFCLCCIGAGAWARSGRWLGPDEVFAQARNIVDSIRAAAAETPITVHKLRGGVSVLEGSGGNIAVLAGADGAVLIDAGITASRRRILDAVSGLSPTPVRLLINTHWHFDHADGNAWIRQEGASILAHENTRSHLAKAQRVEDWNFDFPQAPQAALPDEVFSDSKAVTINGSTLALKHYGPAHTDSDISVLFPEANVLHTGDTYWNGVYPFIDYSTGGGIAGTIAAAETNLALVGTDTIVLPGHGPGISDKAGLRAFRDMLVSIRDEVANLKARGRSLDETIAAKPTAHFDAQWGQYAVGPALFTKLVYMGV
ncbi:MBL fold metallo-hydrolase [Alsobacter sp. KACC 23698]